MSALLCTTRLPEERKHTWHPASNSPAARQGALRRLPADGGGLRNSSNSWGIQLARAAGMLPCRAARDPSACSEVRMAFRDDFVRDCEYGGAWAEDPTAAHDEQLPARC